MYILSLLAKIGSILAKALNIFCLATAIFLSIGFFTPDLEGSGKSSLVLAAMEKTDKKIMDATRDFFPSKYKQNDITRYVALGVVLAIAWLLSNVGSELAHRGALLRAKAESNKIQKFLKADRQTAKAPNKTTQLLTAKVEELGAAKGKDRSLVLKEFINLKKQLEAMTRHLSFLSIDVVDSTGMKVGEDTYVITNDFNEYRQFIELRIKSNQCIKYTTTPDGLMACFPDADSAVRAAQAIIRDLAEFNRSVKHMKRDFIVRCGVNSGTLFFDDTLPLEQISDHVIDVAGHMQKYAKPSTIFAPEEVVKSMSVSKGFTDADMEVDGFRVYKWLG